MPSKIIRKAFQLHTQNNLEEPPLVECTDPIDRLEDSLNEIIPDSPNRPYDMYEVIGAIIDNGEFLEVQRDYAKNIIVGFARFQRSGRRHRCQPAQVPCRRSRQQCIAQGRSLRPLLRRIQHSSRNPVDVPGFLPGTGQEYNGVILHGAKLLYAFGEATVPQGYRHTPARATAAAIVMSCKQLRGDMNYAWPTAEIAVMGGAGAVEVLYAKEAKASDNPARCSPTAKPSTTNFSATPTMLPATATSTM